MADPSGLLLEKHSDHTGAKLGMWLFLLTELLLFGGMFLLYAAYRSKYPSQFHNAALELDTLTGTINTLILLTSSLTMALSILTLQKGNRPASLLFLSITIFSGLLFLVNKYFEWSTKIGHGIYPNSPELEFFESGEKLFYGLYFSMTGLHGVHVIIGAVVLIVMFVKITKRPEQKLEFDPAQMSKLKGARFFIKDKDDKNLWQGEEIEESVDQVSITYIKKASAEIFDKSNIIKLENSGLYWHLVDIIWIFLFPLFYLIT